MSINYALAIFLNGFSSSHFEESEAFHFAGLIRAGEILSSLMPKDHRDYLAAEKYFRMAWRRMPTNSKINHKLGTLYATSDEVPMSHSSLLGLFSRLIIS